MYKMDSAGVSVTCKSDISLRILNTVKFRYTTLFVQAPKHYHNSILQLMKYTSCAIQATA